jgi:phosphate-selective porin
MGAMAKQNRLTIALLLIFILLHAGSAGAAPGDTAGAEQELLMLQKQMQQMQKELGTLESQLESTQQNASTARQQAEKASQDMEQKMAEVSGKFKTLDDLSKKFKNLKLAGHVEMRWWDGHQEQNSFDIYEVRFTLRYDVSENISGEFNVEWHPSGNMSGRAEYASYSNWKGDTVSIERAFAEFRNLNIGPVEGKLLVGKLRNQAFGIVPEQNYTGRVTADNGLFVDSNNTSRITGLQYLTKWRDFRWNFAVFNGYSISGDNARYGSRPAGIRILRIGQMDLDDNNHKAYSTRFIWVPGFEPLKDLTLGYSYFHQKLSKYDLANFNSIMGRNAGMQGNFFGNPTNSKSDCRMGFELAYDYGPFAVKSEYLWGEVADVASEWWYITVGYKLKKYRVDFWLRYAEANYDQQTIPDIKASGAWDKDQWTPCVIYHLHPRADLYFEYYLNATDKPHGAHRLNNNYGFIDLVIKF